MQVKPKNSSMSDEDWRIYQLGRDADNLSPSEIDYLKLKLAKDPSDMDSRVQLFFHTVRKCYSEGKRGSSEGKLFDHLLWIVRNRPRISGHLGNRCSTSALFLTPQHFAAIREIWLEQVERNPADAQIVGNAGLFIVWMDFETGARLLERAQKLESSGQWLGMLVVHCDSQMHLSLPKYKDAMREQVIDVGLRSLRTGADGAPFVTIEYVGEAALALHRHDAIRECAQLLWNDDHAPTVWILKVYLSLMAAREGDVEPALSLLATSRNHGIRIDLLLKVAAAALSLGEREKVILFTEGLGRRVKKSLRTKWLRQLHEGETPDFELLH